MKLADAISELVTALSALSWTSDSGTGTTSFQKVFDYKNYSHTEGYPFACVYETSGSGTSLTIADIEMVTTINVDLCVNWSVIDKSSDSLKQKEANLRLREMWDYVKTQLFAKDFIDETCLSFEPSFARIERDDIEIYIFRVSYKLKEVVNRG